MYHLKKLLSVFLIALIVTVSLTGCSSGTQNTNTNEANQEEKTDENTENAENKEGETSEQDEPKDESTVLNYNLGADPKTLDPGLNSAIDGSHIINNTFEALIREVSGELLPAMAERYEISADGLTYTFLLTRLKMV